MRIKDDLLTEIKNPALEIDSACRGLYIPSTSQGDQELKREPVAPLAHYVWHETVEPVLRQRYELLNLAPGVWLNDWALLRSTCGPKHPAEITTHDMETRLLRAPSSGTRHIYVIRYRTIWRQLRHLGIVPAEATPEDALPVFRKPRNQPRPLSREDAHLLLSTGTEPARSFYLLGCLAGLRAGEVSKIEGSWLEKDQDGYSLRIHSVKNGPIVSIPAHPLIVEMMTEARTFGRLFPVIPQTITKIANKEMARLGVHGTFHRCRHFFITSIYQQTGDILLASELGRHSNLNTTRGYAQLQQGKKRQVLNQLFAETTANTGIEYVSA